MLAVARLTQQVVRTAADHVDAVFNEAPDAIEQAQLAGLSIDDGQHDDAEVHLHLGMLVQVVEDDFRLFTALELEHDTHAVAVTFVADVGDAFEAFFVYQRGNIFN